MKNKILKRIGGFVLSVAMAFSLIPSVSVFADESNVVAISKSNFPDENFRSIVSAFDANGDKLLSEDELSDITSLYLANEAYNISDLTGIDKLPYLEEFYIYYYKGKELDFSKCNALTDLGVCYAKNLKSVKFGKTKELNNVFIADAKKLKNIDVKKLKGLESFSAYSTGLKSVDFTKNPRLYNVDIEYGKLKELKFGKKNTILYAVNVYNNPIKDMDLSNAYYLTYLNVSYTGITNVTKLGMPKKETLTQLYVDGNGIKKFDFAPYTGLEILSAANNEIYSVDATDITYLAYLDLSNNGLEKVDIKGLAHLAQVYLGDNNLKEVDLYKCYGVVVLDVKNNPLTSIDPEVCTQLYSVRTDGTGIKEIDLSTSTEASYVVADKGTKIKLREGFEGMLQTWNDETEAYEDLCEVTGEIVDDGTTCYYKVPKYIYYESEDAYYDLYITYSEN